jgi:hypothetical protein
MRACSLWQPLQFPPIPGTTCQTLPKNVAVRDKGHAREALEGRSELRQMPARGHFQRDVGDRAPRGLPSASCLPLRKTCERVWLGRSMFNPGSLERPSSDVGSRQGAAHVVVAQCLERNERASRAS